MLIEDAARRAHNRDLLNDSASNVSRLQSLASTARALWIHDVALLLRLSLVSPRVRAHAQFVSGGRSLIDSVAFEEQVSEARRESLASVSALSLSDIYSSSDTILNQKRKGHLDKIMRLAQLRSPFDKRLALSAL